MTATPSQKSRLRRVLADSPAKTCKECAAALGTVDLMLRCPACGRLRPQALDRGRSSLLSFTTLTYPKYMPAAVHRLIAKHLEAVERGEIDRLLIQTPPRHGKSELVSIRFPAWYLGRHPDRRIIASSYTASLAGSFGRKVRNLLEAPAYAQLFPGVALAADSSARAQWDIEGREGGYIAAGIGGSITGSGANLAIVDDPIKNRAQADSAVYRDQAWEWFNDVLLTRLEEPSAIVLTLTRWHLDDIAGRLLDQEGHEWTVLRLPAIAEEGDQLGRAVGEALWPERFPLSRLERTRATDVDFDAIYQQRPTARGGSTFKREWFEDNRFDASDRGHVNRCVARWLSFDTALKDKASSDYTSCAVAELMPDYSLNLRHVYREKLTFPDLPAEIERLATRYDRDGKLRGVLIEDRGSGTSAVQTLLSAAPAWLAQLIIAREPTGSKVYRAQQAAVWFRNGSVRLPAPGLDAEWLADFEAEFFGFPTVAHDDQVDAVSQAVNFLELFLAEGYRARVQFASENVTPMFGMSA